MVVAFIMVLYTLLVLALCLGWNRSTNKNEPASVIQEKFISVVISVRNEAKQIERLLKDLENQQYKNFQVIVIDDHSSDDTLMILKGSAFPWLTVVSNPGTGKKQALTEGVRISEGQIVATTDADCFLSADWLKMINQYFQNNTVVFLFGPVRLTQTGSFFSAMQAIEFASLIGTGAATAAFGFPTICNGANLAYKRDAFAEVSGYEGNLHIPSGDDEFLMRKIHKKYPRGIHFAQAAIVETAAVEDLQTFIYQRIRWAAKWRYNTSRFSVVLAIFILLSQIATIACFFGLLTSVSYWPVFLLVPKVFAEAIFLIRVSHFLKIPWNWLVFMVLQIIYPFYVIGVGIASNFISYSWKDRTVR